MEQQHTQSQSIGKLVQALSSSIAEIGAVQKTGKNNFHKYSYASAEDISRAVQPAFAKHGLVLVLRKICKSTRTTEGKNQHVEIELQYRLAHISGEWMDLEIPSEGIDNGDKATFKALTGALKYALVQLCLIPTGDDVEKDSPTAPARQSSRRQKKQTTSTLELIKAEMGKTGFTYELLCKYCELKDRPKPADMDESQQRKLLAFIKTDKGKSAVLDVELI
tara:strand:+ start:112 stop:774 length:663 start_codon:yes stop_codon:yes gene_type:complete